MTVGNFVMYAVDRELRFDKRPYLGGYELRRSLRGHSFCVWRKLVPRISDQILDFVIYLYPSVEDAVAGEAVGGTGFMAGVPSEVQEHGVYLYAVTNSHVIREGASPVVRLNTSEGNTDVVPLTEDNWIHHQDGDDLAVCPLVMTDPSRYRYKYVPTDMFLTQQIIDEHNIGPGDDVFMVGRFVTHEGRQRNTPTARFGNISMMPWEPLPHHRGIQQESFLVETRSLGGYSGSPVFVTVAKNMMRPSREGGSYAPADGGGWLLGVDWGHLPIHERVKEKNKRDDVPEGWVVESNSGQMAVVPAWRLQELLGQEEVAVARRRSEDELKKRKEEASVVLDMRTTAPERTGQPSNAPEPLTQDGFEEALDRVSRPLTPPDPEN